ncbi:MAG: IS982 family transposase, partial [Aquificaceae bacterium]
QIVYWVTQICEKAHDCKEYAIDTFPIPVCENIRAQRSKIAKGKEFRGYIPSKKAYFHGIKLHVVVRLDGFVVEFDVTYGSMNDVKGLYILPLQEEGVVYADRAYNDYFAEDMLAEEGIRLLPVRKENSGRYNGCLQYLSIVKRRVVETVGSVINSLFPKRIHAVTLEGFISKVYLFVLAYNIDRLLKVAT